MDVEQAFSIGAQLALALAHGLTHGIIHLDIKPSNVMSLSDGTIRVLDFGLSRRLSDVQSSKDKVEMTPAYAAPEVFDGLADARSDIYSVGCLLSYLLAGRPPFVGSVDELRILHRQREPSFEGLSLPPKAKEIVRRCLRKDPMERYQDPRELYSAIVELIPDHKLDGVIDAESSTMTLVQQPQAVKLSPRRRRSRYVFSVGAVAVTAALLVIVLVIISSGSRKADDCGNVPCAFLTPIGLSEITSIDGLVMVDLVGGSGQPQNGDLLTLTISYYDEEGILRDGPTSQEFAFGMASGTSPLGNAVIEASRSMLIGGKRRVLIPIDRAAPYTEAIFLDIKMERSRDGNP